MELISRSMASMCLDVAHGSSCGPPSSLARGRYYSSLQETRNSQRLVHVMRDTQLPGKSPRWKADGASLLLDTSVVPTGLGQQLLTQEAPICYSSLPWSAFLGAQCIVSELLLIEGKLHSPWGSQGLPEFLTLRRRCPTNVYLE